MSAPSSDGLNNRFASYQNSSPSGGSSQIYAEQQTGVISDTVKTHYQTESTANAVMSQLAAQRQQIQGANDNVWEMRQAAEKTKRELLELRKKYQAKKNKLYGIIALMSMVDFLLFVRIIQCRGGFFCFR